MRRFNAQLLSHLTRTRYHIIPTAKVTPAVVRTRPASSYHVFASKELDGFGPQLVIVPYITTMPVPEMARLMEGLILYQRTMHISLPAGRKEILH